MNRKKISKQGMYYTIVTILMVAGCLLTIFATPIAEKIALKQQQIATVGITVLSLGLLFGAIEIKKNKD